MSALDSGLQERLTGSRRGRRGRGRGGGRQQTGQSEFRSFLAQFFFLSFQVTRLWWREREGGGQMYHSLQKWLSGLAWELTARDKGVWGCGGGDSSLVGLNRLGLGNRQLASGEGGWRRGKAGSIH